jgi:hypothetical protein
MSRFFAQYQEKHKQNNGMSFKSFLLQAGVPGELLTLLSDMTLEDIVFLKIEMLTSAFKGTRIPSSVAQHLQAAVFRGLFNFIDMQGYTNILQKCAMLGVTPKRYREIETKIKGLIA